MDSPGVKTTYTATVKSPDWCTVLMSALSDDVAGKAKGICKWRQPIPTSAYLIAFAAGNLDSRDIRYRYSVTTELHGQRNDILLFLKSD
jgi:aminopeptidase N